MAKFTVANPVVFQAAVEALVSNQVWRDRALHVYKTLHRPVREQEARDLLVAVVMHINPGMPKERADGLIQTHLERLLEPSRGEMPIGLRSPTARDLERAQRRSNVKRLGRWRRASYTVEP